MKLTIYIRLGKLLKRTSVELFQLALNQIISRHYYLLRYAELNTYSPNSSL